MREAPSPTCLLGKAPRRAMLGGCVAGALMGVSIPVHAEGEDDPERTARPKRGDLLVYFTGDQEGHQVQAADLKVGEPPVLAWAYDARKNLARDGSRLNLVLLVRLDPAKLAAVEKPRAADGIVAFSAICTHQQCPVTEWVAGSSRLRCPCHQSEYDPSNDGRVVAGPAPRPLPELPLTVADGKLQVAGPFTARVGGQNPNM